MQHSVPEKMAPTLPKFFAEEKERVPRSLKPVEGVSICSLKVFLLEFGDGALGWDSGERAKRRGTYLVLSAASTANSVSSPPSLSQGVYRTAWTP